MSSQPEEYISFFSLRGWGKFKDGVLTTEMVYIHAKTMIVDDRVAIIGSANSQSLCPAIIEVPPQCLGSYLPLTSNHPFLMILLCSQRAIDARRPRFGACLCHSRYGHDRLAHGWQAFQGRTICSHAQDEAHARFVLHCSLLCSDLRALYGDGDLTIPCS